MFTSLYTSVRKFVVAHKIMTGVIVLLLVGGGVYAYRKATNTSGTPKYVLAQAVRGTLVSSVTGTGQVSAENQVDVKPQGSSQSAASFTKVYVKQGDQVKAQQVIAVVSNSSQAQSLAQAKASLDSAQANYNKVVGGATASDLATYELAEQTAEQNLLSKIRSSYISIDNAIRSDIDPLYQNPQSDSPTYDPSYFDSTLGTTVHFSSNGNTELSLERETVNKEMSNWEQEMNTYSDLNALAQSSTDYATKIRQFIDDVSTAVTGLYAGGTKYQSTLDQYKSDVATARSAVNLALNDISTSQQSLASAQLSLAQQKEPAKPDQVASAKSQLVNAQASYQNALQNYNDTFLRAPFDGIVAKVNVSVGDQANTSIAAATIITKDQIAKITLNEVDAAKVQLGNEATLTFDAIPDLTLTGTVIQIDTIGTVSQGVVTYNAEIGFSTQDDRVKPGMSVSTTITTGSEDNVILVPSSAVKRDAQGSYVQELPGQTIATSTNQNGNGFNRQFRNRIATSTDATGTTGSTTPQRPTRIFMRTSTVTTSETPVRVPVTVGDSNDTYTVIESGVEPGDIVISQTTSGTSNSAARTTTTGGTNRTGNVLFGGGGNRAASQVPR